MLCAAFTLFDSIPKCTHLLFSCFPFFGNRQFQLFFSQRISLLETGFYFRISFFPLLWLSDPLTSILNLTSIKQGRDPYFIYISFRFNRMHLPRKEMFPTKPCILVLRLLLTSQSQCRLWFLFLSLLVLTIRSFLGPGNFDFQPSNYCCYSVLFFFFWRHIALFVWLFFFIKKISLLDI